MNNAQSSSDSPNQDYTKDFIDDLRERASQYVIDPKTVVKTPTTTPFREKLDAERVRKQKTANDNAEKDQRLKEQTLKKLFKFLGAETIIIFLLAFLQGFGTLWRWKFELDGLSFRIVVGATIGQITAMLIIAVQHLFPRKK